MKRFFVLVVLVASAIAFTHSRAFAVDRNLAGSAQLDYHFVPGEGANLNEGKAPGAYGFDGFTLEATQKVAVDVSNHLSANAKVCFGCHGFEADMAYIDYRVADEFNLRVGRFSPSFGSFNLRHDVANHKLSDKPLPYDMGRMLRMRTWNLGVLPSPFPDNGIEINGTHWFGNSTQFDYAVYAVQGFRSNDEHPVDIEFALSHTPYYVDNNGHPTVGGRLALTQKLGDLSDVTVGASGMYGTYDPRNEFAYLIFGGDLAFRIYRTSLRLEYLARRTEIDTSDPALFVPPLRTSNAVFKQGAYAELEVPLASAVDLLGRFDFLHRTGNVPVDPNEDETPLSYRSWVLRYTLGASYAFERAFRMKLSTEFWQFSDEEDERTTRVGMHLAFVGTY